MADKKYDRNDGTAYLTTVVGDVAADILEGLLDAQDIPMLRIYEGTGDSMRILLGSSKMSIHIYVSEESFEQAKQIVETAQSGGYALEDGFDVGTAEDAPSEQTSKVATIFLWFCVGFMVLLWIVLRYR